MTTRTTAIRNALLALCPIAVAMLMPDQARAATPTYYDNLAAFQADITSTVTDDYSNPGYVFIQNNATMSAVIGETDYMSTGFNDLNIVNNIPNAPYYCAGCNGSFELSFQTTSVGTAAGVNGVGVYLQIHSQATPYFAYITFADGTTANIALPPAGNFWGVSAPERIERIHFGLSNGGVTQNGSFGIDNLIVGDGNVGGCVSDDDCPDDANPCTDPVCNAGVCEFADNTDPCDDAEVCTENDVCSAGVCAGSLIDCNDDNACTDDSCEMGVGCANDPNAEPCDDSDLCTENDVCAEGACAGTALDCNDDNVCSMDSCDPGMGCVNELEAGCCVVDEDCGEEETCDPETNTCVPIPSGTGTDTGDTGSDGTGTEETGSGDTGTGNDGTGTGNDGTGTGNDGTGEGGSGEDTLPGGTGTGNADTATDGGATFGTDSGGASRPGDSGGCNCTTTPSPARSSWWLMVALGLVTRRRRAA